MPGTKRDREAEELLGEEDVDGRYDESVYLGPSRDKHNKRLCVRREPRVVLEEVRLERHFSHLDQHLRVVSSRPLRAVPEPNVGEERDHEEVWMVVVVRELLHREDRRRPHHRRDDADERDRDLDPVLRPLRRHVSVLQPVEPLHHGRDVEREEHPEVRAEVPLVESAVLRADHRGRGEDETEESDVDRIELPDNKDDRAEEHQLDAHWPQLVVQG